MTGGASIPYARFPDDKQYLLLGDSITAVGYPLPSVLGGINVTTGVVAKGELASVLEAIGKMLGHVSGG